MKTLYSANNEVFEYETFGDLLDSLEGGAEFVIGLEYFSAEFVEEDLTKHLATDWILATADDYLYESAPNENGWEIFQSASLEAKRELDVLLKEWTQKHLSKNIVYTLASKSKRHIITEEDLWDGI